MCDFADDTQPPRYGERTLYCNAPGIGDDRLYCVQTRLVSAPGTAIETVSEYANLVWKIAGWNVCLDEILK